MYVKLVNHDIHFKNLFVLSIMKDVSKITCYNGEFAHSPIIFLLVFLKLCY